MKQKVTLQKLIPALNLLFTSPRPLLTGKGEVIRLTTGLHNKLIRNVVQNKINLSFWILNHELTYEESPAYIII